MLPCSWLVGVPTAGTVSGIKPAPAVAQRLVQCTTLNVTLNVNPLTRLLPCKLCLGCCSWNFLIVQFLHELDGSDLLFILSKDIQSNQVQHEHLWYLWKCSWIHMGLAASKNHRGDWANGIGSIWLPLDIPNFPWKPTKPAAKIQHFCIQYCYLLSDIVNHPVFFCCNDDQKQVEPQAWIVQSIQ